MFQGLIPKLPFHSEIVTWQHVLAEEKKKTEIQTKQDAGVQKTL